VYFDKYFSLPTGYRFLLKDIIDFIKDIDNKFGKEDKIILDIGCGTQPYKKLFQQYKYIGMDNYAENQAKPEIEGSVTSIPFKNKELDACMTVWVLDDVFEIDKGY